MNKEKNQKDQHYIYFMRHAHSCSNLLKEQNKKKIKKTIDYNRLQKNTIIPTKEHTNIYNPDLSNKGVKQVLHLHNLINSEGTLNNSNKNKNADLSFLKKDDESNTIVFCSPLVRAIETAILTTGRTNISYKYYKIPEYRDSFENFKGNNPNYANTIYIIPFIKEISTIKKFETNDNKLPYIDECKKHLQNFIKNFNKSNKSSNNNILLTFEDEDDKDEITDNIINSNIKLYDTRFLETFIITINNSIKTEKQIPNLKVLFVSHNRYIRKGILHLPKSKLNINNTDIISLPTEYLLNIQKNKQNVEYKLKAFIHVYKIQNDNSNLSNNENNQLNYCGDLLTSFNNTTTGKQLTKHRRNYANRTRKISLPEQIHPNTKNVNNNMFNSDRPLNIFAVTYNLEGAHFDILYKFVNDIGEHIPDNNDIIIIALQETKKKININKLKTINYIKKYGYITIIGEKSYFRGSTRLIIISKLELVIDDNLKKIRNTFKTIKDIVTANITYTINQSLGQSNGEPIEKTYTLKIITTHLPKNTIMKYLTAKNLGINNTEENILLLGDFNSRTEFKISKNDFSEEPITDSSKYSTSYNNILKTAKSFSLNELRNPTDKNIELPVFYNTLREHMKTNLTDFKEYVNNGNDNDKENPKNPKNPTYKIIKTKKKVRKNSKLQYTFKKGNKVRVPSYADRILYKSANNNQIKAIQYSTLTDIRYSDHLPMMGIYELQHNNYKEHNPTKPTSNNNGEYLNVAPNRKTSTKQKSARNPLFNPNSKLKPITKNSNLYQSSNNNSNVNSKGFYKN